ncbi:hypothetical protein A2631_03615 [Candidatus Daviesbacteria bacterium RIFCSPHIGHO2_01_FULL_44_29]|uniref:Type II secretion system protein GspG C-terminal domain-containing protein n=1 Tax=Candidatus Daviesbacteria bacterium RIFCSPHIGHO2_02_FULL_43_12 TaxID=1797776 RepID=A0A1F5KGH2_9BACT|nr:MAG: hypothetical protein A2631_03615 [Candidatus Daviesbacteria bacterium RIFCSPHIGHO2_01_FULL_44_29]OGE38813.1 MAG: hypothetical protein A3E86_02770 [Candidatus Daviesbacteria bacterium RIFCSPHIGHO2_12_FULL_47_45]OGE39711.1 MAG: hypothetical protein A3D25_03215 [Candidatus Daviesbacteria bacterium RIFCSPHIGHO2_02_FULL_43_12]OGE69999.1 MAG: hypothetical protein A3B55_04880 [Candidatus Daviesbacteria bacterium RIFCSPLOWO2_01_FULL_43_15]
MKKTSQGFTLVELLVVIAIIAVLAAVVVVIVNPVELTKRSRDAVRMSDLATIAQAVNLVVQETTTSVAPPSDWTTFYCVGGITAPATTCSDNSKDGTRANNGTGWVKIDLTTQTTVNLPTLPIDPTNDIVSGLVYQYIANATGYELTAKFESAQYASKMTGDGGSGSNAGLYQIGSNIGL